MFKFLQIKRERAKLKLNLLKHTNHILKTTNNPELLRAVAELLKEIN
ncbi:hypothetical protein PYH66_05410 [Staphylococcus delphini]|nr:hypothetical protein [Staphylococcus delphini]UXS37850.1 hypothetical protein MUA34_05490 [Staphylococcus delphini]